MIFNRLDELAAKYGTDKGVGPHEHGYSSYYFEAYRGRENQIMRVLEIGVWKGSSLWMWAEFFPQAHIHGFDIDTLVRERMQAHPRITCHIVDAANPEHVRKVMDGLGAFDLIIDDGSHIPEEQVTSALTLMPYLAKDGLYVIEDVADHPEPVMREMIEALSVFELNAVQYRWPDSRLFLLRHR